jgi:hypothetical protein
MEHQSRWYTRVTVRSLRRIVVSSLLALSLLSPAHALARVEPPHGQYHHGLSVTMPSMQRLHQRVRVHISLKTMAFPATAHVILEFRDIRAWDWRGADNWPGGLPPLCDDDWGPLLVAHGANMIAIDFGSISPHLRTACATDIDLYPVATGNRVLTVRAFTGTGRFVASMRNTTRVTGAVTSVPVVIAR